MDVAKILDELKAERLRLEIAIESLERLALGRRRRGRPPGWMTEAKRRERPPASKDESSSPATAQRNGIAAA
ncbi:MAG: hypothetical protein ABSH00_16155 [Bryobacteraceae bacterium]|jgi:hypothetical protein